MDASRLLPPRHHLVRRPRRRFSGALRRQPIVFWTLTALAGASTFMVTQSALDSAGKGAEAYGSLVAVVVAQRDIGAGQAIGADDAEMGVLPATLVPDGALDALPVGRSAHLPIMAGEAILASRLAPEAAIGIAAVLHPEQRAMAIPLPLHRPPFEVGQRVDVVAAVDPGGVPGRSSTSLVAERATIVDVADGGITVAVPVADALRIAEALSSAVISVVIHPG